MGPLCVSQVYPEMYGGQLRTLVWQDYRWGTALPFGFREVHLHVTQVHQLRAVPIPYPPYDTLQDTPARICVTAPVARLTVWAEEPPSPRLWSADSLELAEDLSLPTSWRGLPGLGEEDALTARVHWTTRSMAPE